MQYDIYIDSLFLLNLGMNLYLLELTNCILHHVSAGKKILLGAVCGSVVSMIPYIFPGRMLITAGVSFLLDIACLSLITFRITKVNAYLRIVEILCVLTILFGTFLYYVISKLPEYVKMPLLLLLMLGGIFFVMGRRLIDHKSYSVECKVVLKNGKQRMKIHALVDTGNSLVEPISGEPVSVLEKGVFDNLFFQEKPSVFRVIPYRSIDKRVGVMSGYLVPEMIVEWKGFTKEYHNIYVGIQEKEIWAEAAYKMIINPKMLKERKTG